MRRSIVMIVAREIEAVYVPSEDEPAIDLKECWKIKVDTNEIREKEHIGAVEDDSPWNLMNRTRLELSLEIFAHITKVSDV